MAGNKRHSVINPTAVAVALQMSALVAPAHSNAQSANKYRGPAYYLSMHNLTADKVNALNLRDIEYLANRKGFDDSNSITFFAKNADLDALRAICVRCKYFTEQKNTPRELRSKLVYFYNTAINVYKSRTMAEIPVRELDRDFRAERPTAVPYRKRNNDLPNIARQGAELIDQTLTPENIAAAEKVVIKAGKAASDALYGLAAGIDEFNRRQNNGRPEPQGYGTYANHPHKYDNEWNFWMGQTVESLESLDSELIEKLFGCVHDPKLRKCVVEIVGSYDRDQTFAIIERIENYALKEYAERERDGKLNYDFDLKDMNYLHDLLKKLKKEKAGSHRYNDRRSGWNSTIECKNWVESLAVNDDKKRWLELGRS